MVAGNDGCVIQINKGLVQGRVVENVLGGSYYSFQGMRYAKPPLGKLRFKGPVEEDPWEGVYDATKEGSPCISPSRGSDEKIGSEDCLFINVYTNQLPTAGSSPKAVMFWCYGGAWNVGSGSTELFGPDFLLTGDVVVVTFNHRLGVLGLASFEDPELDTPGNALLKDIVRALQWTRENIKYFNGDPNNVTIFGESSGGADIHCISQSKYGRDLYHKMILMSSTNCYTLDEETYTRKTAQYAKMIGFESDNERELYDFLMAQPPEKLVEAGEKLLRKNENRFLRTFTAFPETPAKTEENLFTDPIEKYLTERHPNPKPTMFGSTSEDGMLHASEYIFDGYLPPNFTQVERCVPLDILRKLNITRDSERAKEIGMEIRNFYYGNESPGFRCLDKYVKLQTDLKYRLTGKMYVNSVLKFAPEYPLYFYRFSLDSPANLYRKIYRLQNLKGTCHGDELTYLFNTKYTTKFPKGGVEEKTLSRMVTFWTNFAKYGDPNPRVQSSAIRVEWESCREKVLNHLDIGSRLRMVDRQPDDDRMRFWEQLYENLGISIS